MVYPALVTVLALALLQILTLNVARARGKYKIPAPAIIGNPEFERRYRVQMNTVEQIVIFLPAMWLFAMFLNQPLIAAVLGVVWILGRIWYAVSYYKSAEKRYPCVLLALLVSTILLLGAAWGIISQLLKYHTLYS